jgi:cobalt-zinc-cadmium resistance protein CzcA
VPNPPPLAARGLALKDLQAVLEANNRNDGAGRLSDGEEACWCAPKAPSTLDDVRAIVLQARTASCASATWPRCASAPSPATARSPERRGEAVAGPGARPARRQCPSVVEGVKAGSPRSPRPAAGVTIEAFYDRSNLVERAVGTVSKALLEAIVLVVLLLLAFLGNLRAALVVALMLPLSALATFILMRLSGCRPT